MKGRTARKRAQYRYLKRWAETAPGTWLPGSIYLYAFNEMQRRRGDYMWRKVWEQ